MLVWRPRTIHREHPASRERHPHPLQKVGVCYRGDFCEHFLFRHISQILDRAHQRRSPWLKVVQCLQLSMGVRHWIQSHYYHGSFLQRQYPTGLIPDPSFSTRCHPCKEAVSFYLRLDRYNIRNRVFEQEALSFPMFKFAARFLAHGTKRAVPDDFSNELPHWRKKRRGCRPFCNCHDDPYCLHVWLKERLERDFVWDEKDRLLLTKLDHMIGKMKHLRLGD